MSFMEIYHRVLWRLLRSLLMSMAVLIAGVRSLPAVDGVPLCPVCSTPLPCSSHSAPSQPQSAPTTRWVPPTPSGPTPQEIAWKAAYDLNKEGNRHFKAGDWVKAASCYRRALAADSNRPVIRKNLARVEAIIKKKGLQQADMIEDMKRKQIEKRKMRKKVGSETKRRIGNLLDAIKNQTAASPGGQPPPGGPPGDDRPSAAPAVDLSDADDGKPLTVDPGKMAMPAGAPRSLKIKEPPLPPAVAYDSGKKPWVIMGNAFRAGSGNLKKARRDLDAYLKSSDPDGKNESAWVALETLEQIEEGIRRMEMDKALERDARLYEAALMKALAESFVAKAVEINELADEATINKKHKEMIEAMVAGKWVWPGPTSGSGKIEFRPRSRIHAKRTELMLDALQSYPGDWARSYRYLVKLGDNPDFPDWGVARLALDELKKIRGIAREKGWVSD